MAWTIGLLYLAPGRLSPRTTLLPPSCYQYEPTPRRQLRGWNLQPRWPGSETNDIHILEENEYQWRSGTAEKEELGCLSWYYCPYLFFTPHLIDRSLSPSFIWSIYNVIMHQAGSVDHFWDHGYGPLPWEQISAEDKRTHVQEVSRNKTIKGCGAFSLLQLCHRSLWDSSSSSK